jgi:hypothetical protein
MLLFRIVVFFTILSICCAARKQKQNSEPYNRFKSTKCTSSNISLSGYKCFIKSYSRSNTTLNVLVNLTIPVNFVKLNYDFTYKSLSNSQRSIINATFELCAILNGTGSNPVFKWIIGMMPQLAELLHPCPYQVCCL